MLDAVLLGAIFFGLLHGINPSHGWTVAILYSIKSRRPIFSGFLSSSILAGGHFVSAIAVVVGYVFVTEFVKIPHVYMEYAAAVVLAILAYMFWREKTEDFTETQHDHLHDNSEFIEHEHLHWHNGIGWHTHAHTHQQREIPKLTALASFALLLGFAHEEQFVILAMAAGGHNPLLLMVAYACAVSGAMIGITVLGVKTYMRFQHRVIHYSKYLPKISAVILAVMAIGFALGLF
jgi:ABC-type nickel/cobalt efflux system permease component RcnA